MALPAFLLATDLSPGNPAWRQAARQTEAIVEPCAKILGFRPRIRLTSFPSALEQALEEEAQAGASELFVLPTSFEWNIWRKEQLGQMVSEARRRYDGVAIHHDEADPCHPLLVESFAQTIIQNLAGLSLPPQRLGLLLVADGDGDPASRAQSYRLMRLLWEQLGLGGADIGFVRHSKPFLASALERCEREPLHWILLPQGQWPSEHFDYARTILENHQRAHPDSASWKLLDPPGDHPGITAWLEQRVVRSWREKRRQEASRTPSRKSISSQPANNLATPPAGGWIARVPDRKAMSELLERLLPGSASTILVKVTWHGYAHGTYTDPATLDLLLGGLPGRAVIVEGHTSSRNQGGADFDWETQAEQNRAWIQQQDAEYLRRTGLAAVIARHGAQYFNITEAFWDGRCAPAEEVRKILAEQGVTLNHPELAGFVPESLLTLRGAPFLSFARFKGPTRLGISNLFGLIPQPLRTAWHGPNVTHFASVCCDLAKLYSCLFPTYGIVEALYSAVRWDRQGLYRSRWGNYDLALSEGIVTASQGLVAADILASRLQGQDVSCSAFFDVVKQRLGWPDAAEKLPLPADLQTMFV